MNSRTFRLLVLSSAVVLASTRPRYGGTLRIQVPELPGFDSLVTESLVRLDDRGEIQPVLARSWQRELDGRRYRFFLRSRVLMHDGTPLTAAAVAAALGPGATAAGQQVVIQTDPQGPDLLTRLASPKNALWSTGPYKLAATEPGKRATLTAFEEYWAGRPYLDTLEFTTQRGAPVEAMAVPVSTSRRSIPDRLRLWTSQPRELIALEVPPALAEAFSLSVDRDAIANVITQRRGEPARGLLPEWLSGYASILPAAHDLARARQLAKPAPVNLTVPANDPLLRLIADRVALNARDIGMTVNVVTTPGNAKLIRRRYWSNNPAVALNLPPATPPQAVFEAERAQLESSGIVPLVHIPDVWALDPRLRAFDPRHLDATWMEP